MDAVVYNQKGEKTGSVSLPDTVFGLPWNADLVHQVAMSMESNKRTPVAHTKGRGEVRGGGKKPWRQKGTGRARHGSTRSPIWVGGGVAHGPTNEKVFVRKVNAGMRAKALAVVLSKKFAEGEVLFVERIALSEPKTKLAKGVVDALARVKGFEPLAGGKKNAVRFAFTSKDEELERSFRNIPGLTLGELRNVNALDLLSVKRLVLVNPPQSLAILQKRM